MSILERKQYFSLTSPVRNRISNGTSRRLAALAISGLILTAIISAFTLRAEALSSSAESEAQAIHDAAVAIRQATDGAREMKLIIDEILHELNRPGAQATGQVRGFEERLEALQREARSAHTMREALRADALENSPDDREARRSLRTFHELDQRLRRLDETLERVGKSLEELQSRMREPEPPQREEPSTTTTTQPVAPQTAVQPSLEKETKPIDLSGIWLSKKEEWNIRHNPQDGTIAIFDPVPRLPGRYLEFKGFVKDDTVTASCRITEPDLLNPKLPQKIRQQDAAAQPIWRLKLHLTKDGKLEGAKETHHLWWDKKTLKINRREPQFKKITLVRKESRAVPATPAEEPGIEKKQGAKSPPEPDEEELERLRRQVALEKERLVNVRRAAEERLQRAQDAQRRMQEAIGRYKRELQREREAEAQYNEEEVERLRQLREDLRGMEINLEERFEEEYDRLMGIVNERVSRTGRDEQTIIEEMRQAGELRQFERLWGEVSGVEDDIHFSLPRRLYDLEAPLREAQQGRAQAEEALESAELELSNAERSDDEGWDEYYRVDGDLYRAERAHEEAVRRAQGASRASP